MNRLEDEVQQLIRLEARKHGIVLWRNNSGVLEDKTGRPVRYGLANESVRMNGSFKSSDLIGITCNGQFVAIEVKKEGWTYKGDERETAQKAFIDFVKNLGGLAGFCDSVDSFLKVIGK
jgi:hypothetical protein